MEIELILFVVLMGWLYVPEIILFLKDIKTKTKKQHNWLVWFTDLSFTAMLILSIYDYFIFKRHNLSITIIGTSLVSIGLIIFSTSMRTLGKYFTGYIRLREDHTVVRHGIYKHIRHPAYLGVIIAAIGFPLVLNAYSGLIFSVLFFISILLKIKYEEEALEKQLPEYSQYKKEVGMLLPKIK